MLNGAPSWGCPEQSEHSGRYLLVCQNIERQVRIGGSEYQDM